MKLTGCALLAALFSAFCARIVDRGLNLPSTQGTTRDGAFFPGLLQYEYKPEPVSRAANRAGFSALRLAVNVETANNAQALQKHKAYIDSVGGRGIICMFDTSSTPGASWPRSGTVTGKIDQHAQAWKNVHSVFAPYGDNVMYEIFNEPWGYKADAVTYVKEMTDVVRLAGLPENRVILAGLYGSADVQSVARAGWSGYLAYHVYVFWLPEGQRTKEDFSKRIQQDLHGLSSRVFITEFGVGLDGLQADIDNDELEQDVVRYPDKHAVTSDWHVEHPKEQTYQSICAMYPSNSWCKKKLALTQEPGANMMGADVAAQLGNAVAGALGANPNPIKQSPVYQNDTMAFLRGMRDALLQLKHQGAGVRGLYHWHGWHNGDTWDFWDAANARSSRMIQMMMMDQGEVSAPKDKNADPFENEDLYMSQDFVHDDMGVHMMVARTLGPKSSAVCPEECSAKKCLQGNEGQIGGKHLTGGFCTHNCSKHYGNKRFCGVGAGYLEEDAIDCGGCAHPAMCFGLPCWTQTPSAGAVLLSKPSFLQRRSLQVHAAQ